MLYVCAKSGSSRLSQIISSHHPHIGAKGPPYIPRAYSLTSSGVASCSLMNSQNPASGRCSIRPDCANVKQTAFRATASGETAVQRLLSHDAAPWNTRRAPRGSATAQYTHSRAFAPLISCIPHARVCFCFSSGSGEQMEDESRRVKVASVFSSMHTSVVIASARMLVELKRYNYVTPTNFLELVKVSESRAEGHALLRRGLGTPQEPCSVCSRCSQSLGRGQEAFALVWSSRTVVACFLCRIGAMASARIVLWSQHDRIERCIYVDMYANSRKMNPIPMDPIPNLNAVTGRGTK